ncbi:MAG: glycosyltransferase [Pseudomonadota bacterium]
MKVLFYNWVDYLDPEGRGGGVTIYQRNLIESLGALPGLELTFLCAGLAHDPFSTEPRWRLLAPPHEGHPARRFELVNSGTLAASHNSFDHETQIDHAATREAFFRFLSEEGPFDIVHFNNLEGIPASVLTLKQRFPETRVVYSIHNYYAACPQVNLWFREKATCDDFDNGESCVTCLPKPARTDADEVRRAFAVAETLKAAGVKPGNRAFGLGFRAGTKVARSAYPALARVHAGARQVTAFGAEVKALPRDDSPLQRLEPPHARFRRRRETIARLLNDNADRILAVSARAADVAARFGLSREKMAVSYIGTRHAELFENTVPKPNLLAEDGTLALGYLGYMRRDKGFFFLLDALEAMPSRMASRIHLIIAARAGPPEAMKRLRDLGGTFASVRHADGYTHDNIDEILSRVDVGLVPVLWEDNLPQVAIEMHARHIPLITSDLGGAKELGNSPPMTFEAGNATGFHSVVSSLLSNNIDLDNYWEGARAPTTLEEHRDSLLGHYRAITKGSHIEAGNH